MNKKKINFNTIKWVIGGIIAIFVYAYGFQVTKVDFTEFRKESRQDSRVRITRQITNPDVFDYEEEVFIAYTPIQVPCSPDAPTPTQQDSSEYYIEISPACADHDDVITVKGYNFPENTKGPVSFIPSTDPEHGIALRSVIVRVDSNGNFVAEFEIPDRPNEEEHQLIRAKLRRNVGAPSFSQNAKNTWEKIIETVFLALLATTLGTVLAIPISFLAARNLMKDVKSPLTSIVFNVLGWPIGLAIGFMVALLLGEVGKLLSSSLLLIITLFIITPLLIWRLAKIAFPQTEEGNRKENKISKRITQILIAILVIVEIYLLAYLSLYVGPILEDSLGSLGFLGGFVFQFGDIIVMAFPVIVALGGGASLGGFLSGIGQNISEKMNEMQAKTLNIILSALTGALILITFGAVIDWLYQLQNINRTLIIPGIVGGTLGIILALSVKAKTQLPLGITIYYITRTLLNTIRSIEPLVMVIVAVIWVGIGPFAGVLALALHTVAALAKLYSEQVESILPGPLEAVEATGANRLQTIIYAVVPQIVPPYISFTMYRWDINVRMSTIIGFAGGGGIGSLLFQNLGLADYQAVSLQMIAIAIVVASMDYISSVMRERFV